MPTIIGTSGNDFLAGGAEADTIFGHDGDDELSGNGGNDLLAGGPGNDTLNGGDLHDTLNGDAGNDTLNGGEGHDRLEGGLGADIMRGGPGNDTYIVDDAGDLVEDVNDPLSDDRVFSSISYVLPGGIEDLWLIGSLEIDGTGNGLDNLIMGSDGNNVLSGGAGNDDIRAEDGDDRLFGGAGSDTLWGGAGNDILDGGEGNNGLGGGAGDDLYIVNSGGDAVYEAADSGVDSVQASNAYHLPDNVENLTITITGDANTQYGGMGNASANVFVGIGAAFQFHGLGGDDRLYGADRNDLLNGGGGLDIIEGGDGSDIYWIDEAGHHAAAEFFDHGSSGLDEVRIASYAGGTVTLFAGDVGLERISLLDTSALGINASAVLNALEVNGNMFANRLTATAFADRVHGGGAADTLTGGLGADILLGGEGRDTFLDTAAGLDGDTIGDFAAGDRIVISNVSLANFSFSMAGNVLTYSGGTLSLGSFSGQLQASAAAGGGVQLTVVGAPVIDAGNDFNGDGSSDLAWRHTDGSFTTWLGQPDGGFAATPGLGANPLGSDWKIVGTGDFNGDGKDDLLWRHTSGVIGEWLGQSSGPFVNNGGAAANAVDNGWSVTGVADYNGDGRDDILWRHVSGEVGQWLGLPSGGFANNGGAAANKVDPSWTVVANGDFNGDGRADVLWRHSSGEFAEWQGTASGALVNAGGVLAKGLGSVVGTGDFDADGRDDVLIRASDGAITVWLGQSNGQFAPFLPTQQIRDANWKIASIGDFNGDGSDDLLWRHSSGAGAVWTGSGTGDFSYNAAIPTMDASWQIQSPDTFLS